MGSDRPALRPRSAFNRDNAFFAEGLKRGVVLIQRCARCGRLRNPPRPLCPGCLSFDWDTVEASGRGTIYSYAVHHYPPIPGVPAPSLVVLVALQEGVRMVGDLVEGGEEDLLVGAEVEAVIQGDVEDDMLLLHWRPASRRR